MYCIYIYIYIHTYIHTCIYTSSPVSAGRLSAPSERTERTFINRPITITDTIMHYTILYYTILYYTILCYTTLYYTILYYTILYYTILYYTILWVSHGAQCQHTVPSSSLFAGLHDLARTRSRSRKAKSPRKQTYPLLYGVFESRLDVVRLW